MKQCIWLFLVATFTFAIDDGGAQALIDDIRGQKNGLQPSQISQLKDPFFKEPSKTIERNKTIIPAPEPVFTLKAIFDSRALINGVWVKIGEQVGAGYVLTRITTKTATLTGKKKTKILYLFEGLK